MGSARLLLSENLEAKKYDAYFTKEIRNKGLTKQQIQYQYVLTNAGVYTTGNTVVNIEAKAAKQSASGSPIKLFIPGTQLRIEE
jgi:outer membrane protease